MSLIERFFGSSAPAAPANNAPANITPPAGEGMQPGATPGTTPSGETPATAPNAGGAAPAQSALDRMAELWKNDSNGQQQNSGPKPVFNLTPEKLSEIAGGVDFSKQLPQEMVQKALGGDPNALAALLNTTAQQSFKTSLDATTKMLNAAFAQREESFKSEVLPGLIDQRMKTAAITEANPIFRHPAVEPMLKGLRDQLVSKFPAASSQEISQLATELLQEVATSISGTAKGTQQQTQQQNTGETDWASFLS